MSILEVAEGIQEQTTDEEIYWSIDTSEWGGSPTDVSVKAYDILTGNDVTTTVFPTNSPSVLSDDITLSLLKNLTKDHSYRVEVLFTTGGSKKECFFRVKCTK